MALYNVAIDSAVVSCVSASDPNIGIGAVLFRVGFGDPGDNAQIVQEVQATLKALPSEIGGTLAIVNGPASLPVAMVLSHYLSHRFSAVAVFDPKMQAYVVSSSHSSTQGLQLGNLLKLIA